MQKVKVAKVSIKTGTNKNGEWINTRITSDTNVVFSTFHKSAQEIVVGDLIEIEPQVSDKGNNFDEYTILEKSTAPAPTPASSDSPPNGAYKRDTEAIHLEYGLKAHLQAIERASIEAQTAYNGIISLANTRGLDDKLTPIYEEAIAWARVKMSATLANQAPVAATGAKSGIDKTSAPGEAPPAEEGSTPGPKSFPHVGALLAWCLTNGVDRPAFLNINGATEETLPKINVEDAYQQVLEFIKNRPIPDADIPF